ncbi:MAG TPA: hypothetical protein VG734_02930 [Lacunisphaera sp.]|nr:hypothetical protein [Lacunisphaera sp.]
MTPAEIISAATSPGPSPAPALGSSNGPLAPSAPAGPRPRGRRNADALGLVWVHGLLQVAVFRRQAMGADWSAPSPVHTLAEFETALDQAIATLKFGGTEVFLILEHEQFLHQAEYTPAFSDSAARAYLRARVQRHEAGREPVLWVSQRMASARKESAWLLHLLPAPFYSHLNGLLRARHLDLTRILPLAVPLQLQLEKNPAAGDEPVLIAAQTGAATTVMVGRSGHPLYFARTMQARWDGDSERIAVEINRSLLYAKQQFGAAINRLWLLGEGLEPACAGVLARCGSEKQVTIHHTGPLDWLQAVARLSASHPVNLVAGYINRKRRLQFFRRVAIGVCWLGLTLAVLDAWSRSLSWRAERARLLGLEASQPALIAERDRLVQRNATAERQHEFVRQAAGTRLAPVPARFLALIGSTLPPELSLTDFSAKWDEGADGWTFRLEGQIAAEEESARELLAAWQKLLARSPLRAHFPEGGRAIVPVPVPGDGISTTQRFSIEGGLLEK